MARTWYGHFDTTPEDPRELTAEEWAKYIRSFITDGVRNGGENLEITANDTLGVKMDIGMANVQGYIFMSEADENGRYLELKVEEANPSLPRVDRVILRLNRTIAVRSIEPVVIVGAAGSNPAPPQLVRNNNIYEISLAQIRVPAGALVITNDHIIDERLDEEVCGLINSVLGVDSASWNRQFNELLTQLRAGNDDYLIERMEEFKQQLEQQQKEYDAWFEDIKAFLPSYAAFNFDNLPLHPNSTRKTEFLNDGSILELLVANTSGSTLAERKTGFNPDDTIDVSMTVYEMDGGIIFSRTIKTIVDEDGNIREVVSA